MTLCRSQEGGSGTMPGSTVYYTVKYLPIRGSTWPGRSEVDASAGSGEGLGAACNAQPGLFQALDDGADQVGMHVAHREIGHDVIAVGGIEGLDLPERRRGLLTAAQSTVGHRQRNRGVDDVRGVDLRRLGQCPLIPPAGVGVQG